MSQAPRPLRPTFHHVRIIRSSGGPVPLHRMALTAITPGGTANASSEYTGYRLTIFIGVFTPLQIFAVVLRFYARSLTATSYGLDDGLCVLSLFSQMVQTGIMMGESMRRLVMDLDTL